MACAQRLNQPLTAAHSPPLTEELATQAAAYLTLLQESNARTNLTAIRGKEDISAATSSDTPNKPWPTLPIIILQPGIMDTTRPPQRGNPHRYRSRIRMKTPTNRRKSCTNPAYSALNSSHNLSVINRIRAKTRYTTRFLARPSSPLHPINRPNRGRLVPVHPQRGVSLRTRRAHAQCPTASTSS